MILGECRGVLHFYGVDRSCPAKLVINLQWKQSYSAVAHFTERPDFERSALYGQIPLANSILGKHEYGVYPSRENLVWSMELRLSRPGIRNIKPKRNKQTSDKRLKVWAHPINFFILKADILCSAWTTLFQSTILSHPLSSSLILNITNMVRSTLAIVALVATATYAAPLPQGGKLLTLPSILPFMINITGPDKSTEIAPWYKESIAADEAGLAKRAEIAPWYKESVAADDAGLAKRAEIAPWYKESVAADDAGLAKRAAVAPW
jgi:hypothetical protein